MLFQCDVESAQVLDHIYKMSNQSQESNAEVPEWRDNAYLFPVKTCFNDQVTSLLGPQIGTGSLIISNSNLKFIWAALWNKPQQ